MAHSFIIIGDPGGAGADLAVDPDPNGGSSTATGARAVPFNHLEDTPLGILTAACLDGTSVSALPWAKCTRTGLWIPLAAAQTLTAGTAAKQFTIGSMLNVPLFLQILVNTGNAKRVAWRYA